MLTVVPGEGLTGFEYGTAVLPGWMVVVLLLPLTLMLAAIVWVAVQELRERRRAQLGTGPVLWAAREMDVSELERAIAALTQRERVLVVVGEMAAARQVAADKMVCVSVRAQLERCDESGGERRR